MRLVIDTNLFISSVIAFGAPARLIDAWQQSDRFDLVMCPQLIEEIRDVLGRERMARFIDREEASRLIDIIDDRAIMLPDPVDPPARVRDPKDDFLLALAVDAEATALVSGDRDLLELDDPPVPIWTVNKALDRLG